MIQLRKVYEKKLFLFYEGKLLILKLFLQWQDIKSNKLKHDCFKITEKYTAFVTVVGKSYNLFKVSENLFLVLQSRKL